MAPAGAGGPRSRTTTWRRTSISTHCWGRKPSTGASTPTTARRCGACQTPRCRQHIRTACSVAVGQTASQRNRRLAISNWLPGALSRRLAHLLVPAQEDAAVARALNLSFAANCVLLAVRVGIAVVSGSLSLYTATIDAVLDVISSGGWLTCGGLRCCWQVQSQKTNRKKTTTTPTCVCSSHAVLHVLAVQAGEQVLVSGWEGAHGAAG